MTAASSRLVQGFSAAGHFYMHLFTAFYFVIVLALEAEWRLPYHRLIELWTLGALLVGLGAVPAGWLGDRWSARGMMALFFFGIGAAAIACGLARSPAELLVGLSAIGLFASIYHPVGIAWLVRHARARGKALGFNGIFGTLGVSGAGLVTGALIDLAGWRAAFIVPGLFALATGLLFLLLMRRGAILEGGPSAAKDPPTSRGDRLRAFAVLAVTMFLAAIIYQATQAALPKLFDSRLRDLLGGGTLGVGAAVAIVYGVAGVMQYAGGHLADRFPLKRVYLLCFFLQVPLLAGVAAFAGLPLLAAATLSVLLSVGALPAENMMLARFTPERHRGLAYGVKYVIAFGSAPLALLLVARVVAATGTFQGLFLLLAAFAAVIALAALLLPGERPASRVLAPAE